MCLHVCGRYDLFYDYMASIHKDPRGKSPFWYCAYRLPNGKRTFRSTKMTDRRAAEEFCGRLEYASHESKSGRLIEMRARELISEIVEHATGEPLRNYTAEELVARMASREEGNQSRGDVSQIRECHQQLSGIPGQSGKVQRQSHCAA